MKDKQEQIEEMVGILEASNNPFVDVPIEIMPNVAEALYNVGYRKTFTSDFASDMQKAFKEGYEKGCETCGQAWDNGYNDGYESGKEDGVKEFAEKVKAKYGKSCSEYYPMLIEMTSDDIDELLKEYEVENENI